MKSTFSALILLLGSISGLPASDHADPLVLNPLSPPRDRLPRITDLHVFLDKDADPSLPEAKALILSLCVFPSMSPLARETGEQPTSRPGITRPLPAQPGAAAASARYVYPTFDLKGYRYEVYMDLHPRLGYANAGDRERYGGTILMPEDIVAEVSLQFELEDDATLKPENFRLAGLETGPLVINGQIVGVSDASRLPIRVQTGVYDDPFIFPRFFRTNVLAMVVSIPLDRFVPQQREFLVWAATFKNGRQIDHVGRSQRTQLPRFEALNTLPPARHVSEINRRHNTPTLMEDFMRTFLSPLFARRPYDSAPDVIIFNRSRPTLFPNGRKLEDDVAALTKDGGDAQLWEAAYTDDPRYPRQTTNDKPFSKGFPYLAPPWTQDEVAMNPPPAHLGRATLADRSWRALWLVESLGMVILATGLFSVVQSSLSRWALGLLAFAGLCFLLPVQAANRPDSDPSPAAMMQPRQKLMRVILGGVGVAALGVTWVYALGRHQGRRSRKSCSVLPEGGQDLIVEDRQYAGSHFAAMRQALFDPAVRDKGWGGPYYRVWGRADEKPLPVHRVTLETLAKGWLSLRRPFEFLRASKRTLQSQADLRWGEDGRGFRRLLHPNGVCLSGKWIIDASPEGKAYTGYFRPGSRGLVIARYSPCCAETRGGHWRSLSLVGKVYPTEDPLHAEPLRPAHFITQEDLGGTLTHSVREAVLTNSPPVTPWRRGRGIGVFFLTVATLLRADKQPAERQLYEIAELGKPAGEKTSAPRFMRLTLRDVPPGSGGEGVDCRDEILSLIYDRGLPEPKRKLVFTIEVSDTGERSGLLVQRVNGQQWTAIGRLEFEEAAASYNGDFVVHFHHAPWRNDRNDPGSVARSLDGKSA